MTRSYYQSRLFVFLLAPFLALVGSAHAQLEYFASTTNIEDINDTDLDNIFDQIVAGKIFQVKITGSIIPNGNSGMNTSGMPFGIDGMSSTPIPVIAYVMVDTTRTGPKVTGAGSNIGYQGSQILAVYIHIGPENNPLHEIGYVNFPPLISDFAASSLSAAMSGANIAELWLNQDLETGNPTIASIQLDSFSDSFRFGPVFASGGVLGGVYVEESGDYSLGDVTSVEVTNLTEQYGAFLDNLELRQIALAVAKSKLNKFKKKAKKAKSKSPIAAKKAKKALKKAKKKAKKAAKALDNTDDDPLS